MADQVNALHLLGVKAAFLNSTLGYEQVQSIEQQLLRGELDLLYVDPPENSDNQIQSVKPLAPGYYSQIASHFLSFALNLDQSVTHGL
jgi:ATP-dependent DNA helicase RecQ